MNPNRDPAKRDSGGLFSDSHQNQTTVCWRARLGFPSNQLRESGLNFRAAGKADSRSPLDFSCRVYKHQARQVFDPKPPSEFLPHRAAEVHVEELNFVFPIAFKPMHDGSSRLAAQSEIGIKMYEADLSGAQPLLEIIRR